MGCSRFAGILLLGLLPAWAAPPKPGKPLPLEDAELEVLDAFDAETPADRLPAPPVASRDRPALRWLRANARTPRPENPFRPGSAAHREATALRRLLEAVPDAQSAALAAVRPTLSGTYLGLWRWGKSLTRAGRMSREVRQVWEDRLLAGDPPMLVKDYALRHALCFALAEADEGRLAALKPAFEGLPGELREGWQRLFGFLGARGPVLRFWRLPGRQVQEGPPDMHGRRLWFQPAEEGELPALPEGTTWVVPARQARQSKDTQYLEGPDAEEAALLEKRLAAAGREALFAPMREALLQDGLAYFPILLEMDEQGRVAAIRMGDAAPAQP